MNQYVEDHMKLEKERARLSKASAGWTDVYVNGNFIIFSRIF